MQNQNLLRETIFIKSLNFLRIKNAKSQPAAKEAGLEKIKNLQILTASNIGLFLLTKKLKIMTKKQRRISNLISKIERISDLSESSIEHITKLIGAGCFAGEICELIEDEQIYGWWRIGDGKIDIELSNPY